MTTPNPTSPLLMARSSSFSTGKPLSRYITGRR
jgi:hypothetical protein